jgi:hypothetical protein
MVFAVSILFGTLVRENFAQQNSPPVAINDSYSGLAARSQGAP